MDVKKLQSFTREVPFELDEGPAGDDSKNDGLNFSGYAAIFNSTVRIASMWEGEFDEEIHPGAFADSLREKTPVFQFDHGRNSLVGSIPVGSITKIEEDTKGLYVEARLLDNWLVRPVRDAIAARAITGMSFRFSVPDGGETWTEVKGAVPKRDLSRLDVPELGPVVFPAYDDTEASVRSKVMEMLGLSDDGKELQSARESDTRSADRSASTEIEREMKKMREMRHRMLIMKGIL
jgi:Escherichia/Staphylococcus phage prohead protease